MVTGIAKNRIGEVIRIDTVTSSQADFLATHVPVEHIQIKNKWNGKVEQELSEEDVFSKYVLNSANKHQFIIVIGSSGAGKSHLIRWFAARLNKSAPENEVVLFVRRSDNSLKGTIKQLLELPEVANIPNKAVYDRLVRATATIDNKKLKDMIYQNFIVEIKNDESDDILSNNEKKRLVALLQDELFQTKMFHEDGPIERIYQKVAENEGLDSRDVIALFTEEDFKLDVNFCDSLVKNGSSTRAQKMANAILATDEMPATLSEYMNTLVDKVIQLCAGLEPGDFEQVFLEIRKEISRQGKNLTLLIEDITAFTGVNVALLNVLTTEHTGMYESQGLCRISSIVGTTEKYFNVNFLDNHKDRVTDFFCIPNDVFGMNPDSLYEFVGRYLNAMSLKNSVLNEWAQNGAAPAEYPVHQPEEGHEWDSVKLSNGSKLDLFPFTKRAILNLYNCILQPDYRTPRYLLRDVVERVVRNYLFKKETFPEFQIEHIELVSIGWDVQEYIRQRVSDENEAERTVKFIRIWGDATVNTYKDEETGELVVGSLRKGYFDDLNIKFVEGTKGRKSSSKSFETTKKVEQRVDPAPTPEPAPAPVPKNDPMMEAFLTGQKALGIWIDGGELNLGATTKDVRYITIARDEIVRNFLTYAINWQAEGVSLDNLSKVRNTKTLIGFERQKRGLGDALVVLPADNETKGVLEAFLAYVTIGNNSWDFDKSAMMVYRVQLWLEKWKDTLVKAVNTFNNHKVDYADFAISLEILRQIMGGQYTGATLDKMPSLRLLAAKKGTTAGNSHCSEWNTVQGIMDEQYEKIGTTISQYFNLIQGSLTAKKVYLKYSDYKTTFDRIKKQGVLFSSEFLDEQDPIPQRREMRETLQKVQSRLSKVCDEERKAAGVALEQIKTLIDVEDVDDEELLDLVKKIQEFYKVANDTMFNIHSDIELLDTIKTKAKDISAAIGAIKAGVQEDDIIKTLLIFSSDPIKRVQPLLAAFTKVSGDMASVDASISTKKSNLTEEVSADASQKYAHEKDLLETCDSTIANWR